MYLHEKGKKDFIKELKEQKEFELKTIMNSDKSKSEKKSLIKILTINFAKLIKDAEDSLFLSSVTNRLN